MSRSLLPLLIIKYNVIARKQRVSPIRPFKVYEIDYSSPNMVKVSLQKKRDWKRDLRHRICVFVCFATKAIHILASDLSAEYF